MRRLIAPLALLAVLFGAAGCGEDGEGAPDISGDLNTAVPACPLNAEQVSSIVDRPLNDGGSCDFRDGVASVTIMRSSELAGTTTYDYQRKQAGEAYDKVVDIDHGYIAVRDIQAEAVVVTGKGSYTIIMSSFEKAPGDYEQTLRTMLDKILG